MNKIISLVLREMRVHQWTKNLLVYSALLFGGQIFNYKKFWQVFCIFVSFCLVSSGIYFLNDIFDIENDKADPIKHNRPIASGELSVSKGLFCSSLLTIIGIVISSTISLLCLIMVSTYLFINIFYTVKLKRVVIIDVMIVAYGFVVRAVTGAFAADIRMTTWFLLCVMFISLFLALGKRRYELIEFQHGKINKARDVLKYYTIDLIDQMMTIVTSAMIICYALFTMDNSTENNLAMTITIPLVLYGVFYYLYVVRVKNGGGAPDEALYKEKPILFTVALYVIFVMFIRNF